MSNNYPKHLMSNKTKKCHCGSEMIILKGRRFCVRELKDIFSDKGYALFSNDLTFTDLDGLVKRGLIPSFVFDALWEKLKVDRVNNKKMILEH